MKNIKISSLVFLLLLSFSGWSQQSQDKPSNEKNSERKVRFGGGIQLGIGNGYTTIGISPSAIYEISDKFAAGLGVSYLYSRQKFNDITHNVYGGSALVLYNPIKGIQLSSEFEELNVNENYKGTKRSYWLPAWYMGAAYTMGRHAAIGVRYDVLYDEENSIYDSAFTPFVRVYF